LTDLADKVPIVRHGDINSACLLRLIRPGSTLTPIERERDQFADALERQVSCPYARNG